MAKIITKEKLAQEKADRLASLGTADLSNPVRLGERRLSGKTDRNADEKFRLAFASNFAGYSGALHRVSARDVLMYGGAIHTPRAWSDGKTESPFERISGGRFGKGNTLIPDWAELWDAMRLEVTMRKNAMPTVRQFIYNIYNRPDASRTVRLTEMLPYGIVFEKNNGTGQSVAQGDNIGGQSDPFDIDIFAAGFTWDLLAELFDNSIDMTRLMDSVALGENALKDDNAFKPIFAYDYGTKGTEKFTKANAMAGAARQELMYNTIIDARDALGKRKDPVTNRRIGVSGSYIIASEYDAMHINDVINGLPSTNQKYLPAVSEIAGVIGYDGETIVMRDKTVQYGGCPEGFAFMVKPKTRYMTIVEKAGLTAEIDQTPDVKTLAREEYAWWFAEGQYNGGIQYFVQKIELPAW